LKDLVDRDLVGRAVAGDPQAFAALVRTHYDAIYRMAWRWVGVREDAEDVAQNVCIGLAKAIHSFRGDAEFSTWLYRLTYHAAVDFLRVRKRGRRSEQVDVAVLFNDQVATGPDAATAEGELWDEVRNLPEQQRDAVLLVYAEDMSHAEAARVMGCREKTVSWHLHEARKRLKTRLQEAG
jgi:RNA polymerase sigma-70 factor (ECF subfamily)